MPMLCVQWRGEGHGLVSSEWWVKYARNVPFTIHLLIGLEIRQPRRNTRQNQPTVRLPPSMATNHHTQCFLFYCMCSHRAALKPFSHFLYTNVSVRVYVSETSSAFLMSHFFSSHAHCFALLSGSRSHQGWLVMKEQRPSTFFENILTELLVRLKHKASDFLMSLSKYT